MTNLENAPNDFYLVYFIESHINTTTPKISISGDGGGLCGELKQVKQKIYTEPGQKEKFLYSIYQFKIYPEKIKDREKTELEIKLTLENKGQKFDQKITITDFDKDNYVYDLEFKEKGMIKKIKPPKAIKFSRAEQFEIFKDYLEIDLGIKKKTDKKREDLVFATQKLFKEKFWFNFYIVIFLECVTPSTWRRHFSYFYPLNIEEKGEINELNKKRAKTYVKMVGGNPDKVLEGCKDDKEKSGIQLYTFVLYYYYEYDKEEFSKYLEKNDKNIRYYINNVFVKYSDIFFKQKLPKERVQELIEISKTYNQYSNSLHYLKIFSELLDIILTNFDKLKDFYQVEKKNKNMTKIVIETIIEPREEDNMKDISEKYKKLIDKQKEAKFKEKSIFTTGTLFDKYTEFFEGKNLDNLYYIKAIKQLKVDEFQKDINKSIYDTALKLCQKGNMDNFKILGYIKRFIDDSQIKESLEIIPGLDINKFDDDFLEEWKKIDWNKKLENKESLYKTFTDKVLVLITDLKDFDKLFKLFNISSKPEKIEIKSSSLDKMRNKFIELFKNNKDIEDNKYIIKLITIAKNDKKEGEKAVVFLGQLQQIFSEEKMKNIYETLLSEYGDSINGEIIKFIINFYTKDRELNSEILLNIIIKSTDKIKGQFLDNNINNYIPHEIDFLSLEESEQYKLFKGLLGVGIINNKKFSSSFYIEQSKSRISLLQKKLVSQDIKWTEISTFYNEADGKKDKDKTFEDKLKTIFLNDEDRSSDVKLKLDECNRTIKEKTDSLKLILEDFLGFFNVTQKDNIIELREHIKNMTSGPINYYNKNKSQIDKLIDEFKEDAKIRYEKNKSSIFGNLYKKNKTKKDR